MVNTSVLRHRVRRLGLLASALSLLFTLGAAAAPSSAPAAVTSYQGGLNGVSAVSRNDAWAVGGNLILHWNGVAWTKVPSPNPNGTSNLAAVTARSPSEAWAVGAYCTAACNTGSAVVRGLILQWNGTAWTKVAIPNPPGAVIVNLQGVTIRSPSDAWAVGDYCTSTPCYSGGPAVPHRLILHWNGSAWRMVASPDPGGSYGSSLSAVTALSSSSAWAVGSYGTKPSSSGVCPGCPGSKSLVLHWNGSTWVQQASPSRGVPPGSGLSAVSALSASDAWAVGNSYLYSPDQQKSLALRWNGSGWAQVASPSPGPNSGSIFTPLNGVSALSASDAWAVGSRYVSTGYGTLALHWNGTSWTVVPSPNPGGFNGSFLNAVSGLSPSDMWAVGYYDTGSEVRTLILHWNGISWTRS